VKRHGRPTRAEPQPLGRVLDELAARRRWSGRLDGARIFDVWDEVAGPDIGRHARPVRLHGGVLVVAAADPGWATQLRYLAADLQARANSALGPDAVRSVQVVLDRPET
jgi:predicted nucleic acid-binding Zn ribbon protein